MRHSSLFASLCVLATVILLIQLYATQCEAGQESFYIDRLYTITIDNIMSLLKLLYIFIPQFMNNNDQFIIHLLFLNASPNTEDSLPLPLLKWLSK